MRNLAVAAALAAAGALLAACRGSQPPLPTPTPPPAVQTPSPTPDPTPTPLPPTPTPPAPTPTPEGGDLVSLEWLTWNVPVLDLPAQFAPPVPDPQLEALISEVLQGYEGRFSAVVHHLGDGRYAVHNGEESYYAASLYKLGLLLEAYRQRDAGEISFDQVLTLEKEYVKDDVGGTLELLGLKEGDLITLRDALRAMIVISDTPTAIMVQDVVTPARVDATLRSLGIQDTSFNNRDLPITAPDATRLLEAIAAGEGVSQESRREMLSLLLQEAIREGIPAGVPAGTPVAHKTGNWYDATHDVALVWGPSGPYVIAVLTDRPWEWEPIVELSRAVYGYFAGEPQAPEPGETPGPVESPQPEGTPEPEGMAEP